MPLPERLCINFSPTYVNHLTLPRVFIFVRSILAQLVIEFNYLTCFSVFLVSFTNFILCRPLKEQRYLPHLLCDCAHSHEKHIHPLLSVHDAHHIRLPMPYRHPNCNEDIHLPQSQVQHSRLPLSKHRPHHNRMVLCCLLHR